MTLAFKVGSLFGITVRIHVLFVVLFALPFVVLALRGDPAPSDAALGVPASRFALLYLLLFVFVLLHELGHSMVARRRGIEVHDIVLWPLGGIARLGRMPDDPATELRVALAGPAVNFALALAFLPFHLAFGGDSLDAALRGSSIPSYVLLVNVVMGAFNLVPAFPMDGGRVFRALLSRKISHLNATRVAVAVGRGLAVAALVAALLWPPLRILALVAPFVWIMAGHELRAVVARHDARG